MYIIAVIIENCIGGGVGEFDPMARPGRRVQGRGPDGGDLQLLAVIYISQGFYQFKGRYTGRIVDERRLPADVGLPGGAVSVEDLVRRSIIAMGSCNE